MSVLDISDFRFPGGTSQSIAEEIRAQVSAGWRTGLLHLNGPLVTRVAPVHQAIREQIDGHAVRLLVGRAPIEADVAVIRHPAVLQHAADQLPPVRTERVVVVANAAPHDIDGHEHYQPEVAHQIATDHFGVEPSWAPIGPLVRDVVAPRLPPRCVRGEDWTNIINVDSWATPRTRWRGDRPVIGRHSRSSPQKWPRDPAVLRAVYPTDGSMYVKILGGAEPAAAVLGEIPAAWDVREFGAAHPRNFLAGLDFFVYYHDPRWVEAFGRTILEALASGVPAILPPHFRPLFGDAALYAEPDQVGPLIAALYGDRTAYQAHVAAAESAARARFGYEAHVARLTELIGAPTAPPKAGQRPAETPATTSAVGAGIGRQQRKPTILFISSNGAGMGHLTRLLAYARRAAPWCEPRFLSLSQAVGVVGTFGYPYEYVPSARATGMFPKTWHALFAERVGEAVARLAPEVVIFDGTWPYDGIRAVQAAHPGPRWVWSRRGMWRAGLNQEQLAKAAWFDAIIEPGDFARAYDRGATATASADRVPPVTLIDPDELDDRVSARRALGLDPAAPVALVSLGAGNINDTSGVTGATVAALRELGLQICVTQPEIANSADGLADVQLVREYPLARRYRAFDLAVSAAGYNSFHELLRCGVPTLFIPNQQTSLDDQAARARWVADRGFGHALESVTVETLVPLLADLLERGPAMADGLVRIDPGNGASAAADLLLRHADRESAA